MNEETQEQIQQDFAKAIRDINRVLQNAVIAAERAHFRLFGKPITKIQKPSKVVFGISPCQLRIRAWQQHRG